MMEIMKFLIILLFLFLIAFGLNFLLTKIVLWISAGLFNYPLDDKFWYVFALIAVIQTLFNKGNKTTVERK